MSPYQHVKTLQFNNVKTPAKENILW